MRNFVQLFCVTRLISFFFVTAFAWVARS